MKSLLPTRSPAILHVLDHSIPMHSGYSFRTIAIVAQQRAMGWRPILLTGCRHLASREVEEEVDGWQFFRTPPIAATSGMAAEAGRMRALARRLDEVVEETQPDIIHAHSPVLNLLPALWVGRRRRLPVVYEIRALWEDAAVSHGTASEGGLRYRLTRAVETLAARRADAVTTICEGLRGELLARGVRPERLTVIPNAVDEAAFTEAGPPDEALAEALGLKGKQVLGFIGSFYRYEGLHLLLEALPLLLARLPEVRLLLVGGGPEEEALKAQAAALGRPDAVVFSGRVAHERVQSYYSLLDMLVLPRLSMRLTQLVTPLKPLEAMAQGKLVVASDVGGHRELIRDGQTGYLFAPDDAKALADCVALVLASRDQWSRVKAEARRVVETERTWKASVGRYEGVYRRLLEPGSLHPHPQPLPTGGRREGGL
jgi:PEP-CTERM/exosortase A-associated glycosyltransferase